MTYTPPFIIAEIGCNHKGDLDIALEMIRRAKTYAKVDAVKFQKRNNRLLLPPEQYDAPHPNPDHAYGPTYGAHREFLEFDLDQHRQLKALCDELDLVYSSSVWDLISAQEIASLQPAFIKIPSACNLNGPMLDWLCLHYAGQIHVSTGMTTPEEIDGIIQLFAQHQRLADLVVYNCTSGYPVAFDDICLLELPKLQKAYGHQVQHWGFSGHHLGIAVDVAAYTLGATYIERHFTLDRTWKGTDHAASLEPEGLRKLARDLRAVHQSLRYKSEAILPVEQVQRNKLKQLASLAKPKS